MARMRIRPSRPVALFGAVFGTAFVIVGLVSMYGGRNHPSGAFVFLWVVVGGGIVLSNLYWALSNNPVGMYDIDVESEAQQKTSDAPPIEIRLKDLKAARDEGLISEEEFQAKRTQILNSPY